MADPRISEDYVLSHSELINTVEDQRKVFNDALKDAWADFREELKTLGLSGKEIAKEVADLKDAIADTRMSQKDRAKASDRADGKDSYLAILNSPRARARIREAEITETQPSSTAGSDLTTPPSLNGQVAPIQPETAISFADVEAHDAEANQSQSNAVAPVPATQDGSANAGGGNEVAGPNNDHEMEKGREPVDARHGADREALGSAVETGAPLSFSDKIKKLRPLCQRPERCASSGGRNHCHSCMKNADASAVSA